MVEIFSNFCFDFFSVDQNFFNKNFWGRKKNRRKFWFQKIRDFFFENVMKIFQTKISRKLFLAKNIFFKKSCFRSKISQKFFDRPKKYFLEKLRNFFEHQYRSKMSLRIEWEHSQPLKFTLKYSNLHPMNLYQELTSFGRLNKTNAISLSLVTA